MPKKNILALVFAHILIIFPFSLAPLASSESLDVSSGRYDTITKELNELKDALGKSVAATKPLQSELDRMQNQIKKIKNQVIAIEYDMQIKKKEIDNGYKNLARKQELILYTIRDFYIKSYTQSPLNLFLEQTQSSERTQEEVYQEIKTNQDRNIITNLALSITSLENKKQQLIQEQKWLVATKVNLDEQAIKLDKIVTGALEYQKDVSAKIQELSAQQQAILNARSGSFTATIGDSDLADDYKASIKGFRESAPAGSFAVFSFGAHTHRKGMSQYGAFARANAGQDFKTILKAYYGKEPVGKDTGGTIKVTGFGEIDFENRYLYGIAEMPSTWPKEALKAQAIAARTYAYRYKQQGSEICTNEACQVFNSSKADNPPDSWKQAVDETKGQILEDVVTYYSSTTGGYLTTMGWDTTDGNGGSNFADKSYEKIAGSPWFYKSWYTKGYSISSDKCGRDNPWLSSSDIADLINASFVLNNGTGDESNRITPPTTSCWGGNPYSQDELRQISDKYGGGVNNVTGVSVLQGNGITNEVVFQTNKGEKRISGSNFKTAFNLRAPGYLSIPQNGFAFFNIEQK